MGMPPKPQKGFKEIDIRLGVTVFVSVVVYYLLTMLSMSVSNYLNVCILAICTAFIADIDWKTTWKSGLIRLAITSIGAVLACVPNLVYDLTGSELLLMIVFGAGAIIVVVLAKFLNVMYVQCRLAVVSYILAVYTFHGAQYAAMGKTGYGFSLMWILSTLLGIVISFVVAFLWDAIKSIFVKKER